MKYIFGNWLHGGDSLIDLTKIHKVRICEGGILLFPGHDKDICYDYNTKYEGEEKEVWEEIKNWIPVVGHVAVKSISKRSA